VAQITSDAPEFAIPVHRQPSLEGGQLEAKNPPTRVPGGRETHLTVKRAGASRISRSLTMREDVNSAGISASAV
jgi:hypothetical protein